MNDYLNTTTDQWIKASGVLNAKNIKAYQIEHHLSDGEMFNIIEGCLLAARRVNTEAKLNLHGFKQYYFYSYILNHFDHLIGLKK